MQKLLFIIILLLSFAISTDSQVHKKTKNTDYRNQPNLLFQNYIAIKANNNYF